MSSEVTVNLVPILLSVMGAIAFAFMGLFIWGIKKLVTTTFENTVAIRTLSAQMNELVKIQIKVPVLEDDINEAHAKIREILNSKGHS